MSTRTSAITIPAIRDEMAYWLSALPVREGQAVEKGTLLARLEGKDFSYDLISPHNGYIIGLHAIPGQIVNPDQVLCYVGSQPSVPSSQPSPRTIFPGPAPFDPTALLIFGGGGHGKAVIDLVRTCGLYRVVGIIDDGLTPGSDVMGVTVLGGAQDLSEWQARGVRLAINAVGGIGNVGVRLKIFEILAQAGFTCPPIVHPSAVIEPSALLEAGVQILAQTYVGSAVRIGFGTVLNAGVVVSHDCVIGKVVNLSPGATLAGNVRVEDHAQIGMRATVNLGLTVGKGSLVGNGATVKSDVPSGTRVRAGAIWPAPVHTVSQPTQNY
jgi:acetyltransferase EpsM